MFNIYLWKNVDLNFFCRKLLVSLHLKRWQLSFHIFRHDSDKIKHLVIFKMASDMASQYNFHFITNWTDIDMLFAVGFLCKYCHFQRAHRTN